MKQWFIFYFLKHWSFNLDALRLTLMWIYFSCYCHVCQLQRFNAGWGYFSLLLHGLFFFQHHKNTFLNVEKKTPFYKNKQTKTNLLRFQLEVLRFWKQLIKKRERNKRDQNPRWGKCWINNKPSFLSKVWNKSVLMFVPSEDEALKYFSWEWSFSFNIVLKCLPVSCVSVLCASSRRHSVYCALNNMVVWVHAGLLPSLASCYTAFRHCKADKLLGTWSPGFTSKQVLY